MKIFQKFNLQATINRSIAIIKWHFPSFLLCLELFWLTFSKYTKTTASHWKTGLKKYWIPNSSVFPRKFWCTCWSLYLIWLFYSVILARKGILKRAYTWWAIFSISSHCGRQSSKNHETKSEIITILLKINSLKAQTS